MFNGVKAWIVFDLEHCHISNKLIMQNAFFKIYFCSLDLAYPIHMFGGRSRKPQNCFCVCVCLDTAVNSINYFLYLNFFVKAMTK